jgi:hypothetical protein
MAAVSAGEHESYVAVPRVVKLPPANLLRQLTDAIVADVAAKNAVAFLPASYVIRSGENEHVYRVRSAWSKSPTRKSHAYGR